MPDAGFIFRQFRGEFLFEKLPYLAEGFHRILFGADNADYEVVGIPDLLHFSVIGVKRVTEWNFAHFRAYPLFFKVEFGKMLSGREDSQPLFSPVDFSSD